MTEIPTEARVMIVEGETFGTSVLYCLASAGRAGCALLECRKPTKGSVWAAPGDCPTVSTGRAVQGLNRRFIAFYGQKVSMGFPQPAGRRGGTASVCGTYMC